MAKAKSQKNERQAKIDAIRGQQKSDERRRGLMIVGVCVVVALLIVGAAAYQPIKSWMDQREFNDLDLAAIGVPASECADVETKPATGNAEHVEAGQQVTYDEAPPAFGPHWNELGVAPAPFERKFYTASDRPELESLVHNLEHGYTILWYDATVADDDAAVTELRALAGKFGGSSNQRSKFIAAPWTSEDGDAFPDDMHVAFSHWSGDASDPEAEQTGVWQYCSATSGEALDTFMKDYPYLDSPEPTAG